MMWRENTAKAGLANTGLIATSSLSSGANQVAPRNFKYQAGCTSESREVGGTLRNSKKIPLMVLIEVPIHKNF